VSSDVDILGTENSLRKKDHKDFALIGRCILVDGLLVVSSMPLQYRSLFTQWFSVQSKVQPFTQVSLPYLKEKEGTLRHKWYQFYPYQIASHAKVHPNLFLLSTCEDSVSNISYFTYFTHLIVYFYCSFKC
jgi:hypothetical protein